jgi:hypothetical protein
MEIVPAYPAVHDMDKACRPMGGRRADRMIMRDARSQG